MARNEGWSLVIPTEINGVQCQAVIDTAAQVTVVSERIFQDMTPQPLVVEEVILKDATAINNIPAKVVKSISVRLGKQFYDWNIYVASLADEVILGIDFLKENKGIVNLQSNQVTINDEIIQATLKKNGQGTQHKISRVTTKKKVVLPPYTMKIEKGFGRPLQFFTSSLG